MDFELNRLDTPQNIARRIGYKLLGVDENGEYNMARDLTSGRRYPRFHIYLKEDRINDKLVFNLHLDQKSASYGGSGAHRHSGEYDGGVIEGEVERVKNILSEGNAEELERNRTYKF